MMRSRTLLMVTVAALALGGCAWGQMRGNAQRSGVNYFAPGITVGSIGELAPAWTTPDRGATANEVTTKDGRVFFAGSSALWAVDLATGNDLWHVDRTNGHQTNDLISTTAWTDNGVPVVGMNQFWSDSISGTPYFQWLARIDLLDPATGSVLGTRTTAAQTPPLDAGDWIYFPINHLVAQPASLGGSILDLHLDARALDGSGAAFNIPLNSPLDPISSLAVNNANLYLRTLAGPEGVSGVRLRSSELRAGLAGDVPELVPGGFDRGGPRPSVRRGSERHDQRDRRQRLWRVGVWSDLAGQRRLHACRHRRDPRSGLRHRRHLAVGLRRQRLRHQHLRAAVDVDLSRHTFGAVHRQRRRLRRIHERRSARMERRRMRRADVQPGVVRGSGRSGRTGQPAGERGRVPGRWIGAEAESALTVPQTVTAPMMRGMASR